MIDKNKAYRFRGDSERWVWRGDLFGCGQLFMNGNTAEHIHERGILLEYPELPGEDGEDWEFCDGDGALQAINSKEKAGNALVWDDVEGEWTDLRWGDGGIYCRKKKPVYRSGAVPFSAFKNIEFTETVYWTTDPVKGKELLS